MTEEAWAAIGVWGGIAVLWAVGFGTAALVSFIAGPLVFVVIVAIFDYFKRGSL